MGNSISILAILGSLRRGSYNRGALRAAREVLPAGATLEDFTLEDIPSFNQDDEARPPERIALLKSKIAAADAVLIVTPEYNFSIPGVLKNAIDWTSRPEKPTVWRGKPVGIMGASAGTLGTARAQIHLRQVLLHLDAYPVNGPEVLIASATERFDGDSNLIDKTSREWIAKLLVALILWTRQLAAARVIK
jgi:chromate reductase